MALPVVDDDFLRNMVARIVADYVSNPDHALTGGELRELVFVVRDKMVSLANGQTGVPRLAAPSVQTARPAQTPPALAAPAQKPKQRQTVFYDHIICLEDGRPYQTLVRTLSRRGLTPDAYRKKWSLPPDYPMTCEATLQRYAKRSEDRRTKGPDQRYLVAPADAPPKPAINEDSQLALKLREVLPSLPEHLQVIEGGDQPVVDDEPPVFVDGVRVQKLPAMVAYGAYKNQKNQKK